MFSPADLSRLATALGGLPISGCAPGSPAALAGVCYGDIVLSVNGMPTASWSDFFQARRRSAGPLRVRVFRRGLELEASMTLPLRAQSPRAVLDEHVRREVDSSQTADA
jgi:S1-C subfamily serine protease